MKAFFRIYRDRFWQLTLLNIVYFCCVLPLLFFLYICLNAYTGILVGDSSVADVLPGLGFFMPLFSYSTNAGRVIVIAVSIVSVLLFGPVKCALFMVQSLHFTGNYRFFADVWSKLRKKLSQTLILGLLDILVLGRTIANLCGVYFPSGTGALFLLLRVFSLIVLLFWLIFRRWLYLLSANCNLRLWPLIRNCLILTVSGLGKTSQCTAACVLIWALTFLTLPIVTVILLPLFSYSAAGLATVCALYAVVKEKVLRDAED